MGIDPVVDMGRVEAQEMAPLDVGDAVLEHESSDVADGDAEPFGDLCDVEQSWPARTRLRDVGSLRGSHDHGEARPTARTRLGT